MSWDCSLFFSPVRVAMPLAVLNRHAGVSHQEHGAFVNVVGRIRIDETAWDLPARRDRLADEVQPVAYHLHRRRLVGCAAARLHGLVAGSAGRNKRFGGRGSAVGSASSVCELRGFDGGRG